MQLNPKQFTVNVSGKRYIIHQGGTRSGKTYSILQFLLIYMLSHKRKRISIVGQSWPHLNKGVLSDIKQITEAEEWQHYFKENKTNHTLACTISGSYIEFFSAAAPAKLRGPKRDILFINECNTVSWESFLQLDVRTSFFTFLDFNPASRFWVHNKLMPIVNETEHEFLRSTYKDNCFLSAAEIASIERQRCNAAWWRIYGEGETGNPEGRVFSNWKVASQHPPTGGAGSVLGYGIDFGFTHSPTAVVQVNELEGELWVKEIFYSTATQNEELFNFLQGKIDFNAPAYGDPSSPQTIDFLYHKGWRGLRPAKGGKDSVEFGLNLLLERVINISSDSKHLILEMQEYEWDKNKEGEYIGRPKKANDHAIDAMRYVISSPKPKKLLFA